MGRTLRWVGAVAVCGAGFALATAWAVTMFLSTPAKQVAFGQMLVACVAVVGVCQAFWPRRGSMPTR